MSIIIVLTIAFAARQYLNVKEEARKNEPTWMRDKEFAAMASEDNIALQYFREKYPERAVLLACEEDINDDKLVDLLIIYKENVDTRLVAVCNTGDGNWYISPEIPAPIENQTIRFKNIDNEAEMEFIVSGEKKGAVGYTVFPIRWRRSCTANSPSLPGVRPPCSPRRKN